MRSWQQSGDTGWPLWLCISPTFVPQMHFQMHLWTVQRISRCIVAELRFQMYCCRTACLLFPAVSYKNGSMLYFICTGYVLWNVAPQYMQMHLARFPIFKSFVAAGLTILWQHASSFVFFPLLLWHSSAKAHITLLQSVIQILAPAFYFASFLCVMYVVLFQQPNFFGSLYGRRIIWGPCLWPI